jgi:hypothetical protein
MRRGLKIVSYYVVGNEPLVMSLALIARIFLICNC